MMYGLPRAAIIMSVKGSTRNRGGAGEPDHILGGTSQCASENEECDTGEHDPFSTESLNREKNMPNQAVPPKYICEVPAQRNERCA